MAELPPFLFIQMARFGYKAKNELSGVDATRVKHVRKCAFSPTLDVFDYCSPEMQDVLKVGRLKSQQKKEEEDARKARIIANIGSNSTDNSTEGLNETVVPPSMAGIPEGPEWRKEVVSNPDNKPLKDYSTGTYELVGIVSHKGRSAEGGHYVSWVRAKKAADLNDEDDGPQGGSATSASAPTMKKSKPKTAKSSEEDTWYCYDDEEVTSHPYKNICGLSIDLQGGRADTPIAYVLLYKRVPCIMPDDSVEVHKLGTENGEKKSEDKKEEGYPEA
jgi:ubiquitin carboxyl-terminal hydrolase 14